MDDIYYKMQFCVTYDYLYIALIEITCHIKKGCVRRQYSVRRVQIIDLKLPTGKVRLVAPHASWRQWHWRQTGRHRQR